MTPTTPETLLDQLNWRYATKQFDPTQKIPTQTWETLATSLVLTPSSFGLQPWHFFLVQDPDLRQQLLPHSWNQTQVTDCSHFLVLAAKTKIAEADVDHFLNRTTEIRGGDPSSLEPYRQMMLGFISQMSPPAITQWAKLQTYIALGQLMTSAAALGIDACPMEGISPENYDDILDLPSKNLTTSVACALGYRSSADKYANAPKVRFLQSEVLTVL